MNPYRIILPLFLFSLAFGVRLIYLQEFPNNPLFDIVPQAMDHFNFDQAAINFAEGDLLARSPNNSFSPLYKYFLGVLYWLFGRNFYVIYSVQFALGALGSVLVYWIGRDLFGTRAGLIAFFGFALYSTQIFYEGILLRASFITFLGLLSFFLLTRLQKELTISRLVVATLALSLFFQARPNTLLCLPPVLVFLHCYVFRGKPGGEVARSWSVFTGVLLLSFIPLLVQCYVVHGRFVFFDASGPHTFIAGNLTSYSGVGFEEQVVEDYRKQNILGYGSNIQYLLGHIAQSPWEFFKLYLRKVYFFFNDFEAPSNLSVYLYREFSEWSGKLLNHFALYSSLGLAGMALAARQRKPVFLLASFALALTLSVVLFLNESRYRLPAVPYYILFGAYAASTLIGWTFQKHFKDAAILAAVAALLFFTFLEPKGIAHIRTDDYNNAALAWREKGNLAKANEFLDRALALNPRDPTTHFNKGQYFYI
ncbi:MAG: glycosyltransferase family 39 protein, partial [Nitrospinales bacterium]